MELIYDEALSVISELETTDEVREFTDRTAAVEAYAKQMKDRTLEINAVKIRLKAERKLGAMLIDHGRGQGQHNQAKVDRNRWLRQ